jgi:hypothetical protein
MAEYQDAHWAAWCMLQDLDPGDVEDQGDDFDGDSLPPIPPPRDEEPVSAELSALLEERASEHRRRDAIVQALEAGDADRVLSLARPEVLASADALEHVIELAGRLLPPPPPPPERPFQPPVLWPDHPLSDSDGRVSHGIQFTGSTGKTPLEALHELFTEKARLLAWMASLEGRPGNIAGAMSWQWNASMQRVEAGIESAGRLLGIDASTLHEMDLKYTAAARRRLRMEEKARQQPAARGPGRVHAAGLDYLGRQVPDQERPWRPPFETPEAGWSPGADPAKKIPARPRRRRIRNGRPRYRMARARV